MQASSAQRLLVWLGLSPSEAGPDPDELTNAEWDELLAQVVGNTVAPQFFERLTTISRSSRLPADILRCAFLAMVRQQQETERLRRDLTTILRSLNGVGVAPILLKGAHLSTLYAHPSHRSMRDIDLLVRPEELEIAEDVLLKLGYENDRTRPIADSDHGAHLPAFTREGGFPLELHFGLSNAADRLRIDHEGIRQRSLAIDYEGESARVFCPEDLLLYVCLHAGVRHNFAEKGLRPLLDVGVILQRHGAELDWAAIASRARQWGIERATRLLLVLARQETGVSLPGMESFLAAGKTPSSIVTAARTQLFDLPSCGPEPLAVRSIATGWLRPQLLWEYVFHPSRFAESAQTPPSAQARRLIRRYGGFMWRSLRHDPRQLLATLIRTRRHAVLLAWLAETR